MGEAFAQAAFVVVPSGWLDGQSQELIAERVDLSGAGDEDVFKGRSLKDAIVGGVQHHVERWQVAANREARAKRILIEEKLIVVPAKAGADRPIAEADEIFDEGRLFEVRTAGGEAQAGRGVVVKLRGIGDVVLKIFMQKGGVGLNAGF